MDFVGLAKAIFSLVTALFGYAGQRSALNNTDAMRRAARAQKAADFRSKMEKALLENDLETLRALAAE